MIFYSTYCRRPIGLVILAYLLPLYSQQWRTTGGPEGGEVNALVQCKNSLFAGTHSGVWKSTDEGESWQYCSLVSPITNMCSIGRYIFAVTFSEGVLRSGDEGATWEPVNVPIDRDRRVNMIGSALGVVVAGAAGGAATLFISTDSGTTWKNLNAQAGFPKLINCSSMQSMESFLFLSSSQEGPYGGIIRSADTGKTWERFNEGLPMSNILAIGKVDTVLLAGRDERIIDEGCIFISNNKGISWIKSQTGLPESWFKRVLAFGTCGKRIYVAVLETTALITNYSLQTSIYASDDFGAAWQRVEKGLPDNHGNCFLSLSGRLLLAPKCGGIFSIGENDSEWRPANNGLSCMPISALCIAGNRLLCSAFNYLIFGYNKNDGWAQFPMDLLDNTCITAIGTTMAVSNRTGVLISNDNGAAWTMTDTAGVQEGFKGAVPSFWGKPLFMHEGYVFCAKWDGIFRTNPANNITTHVFTNTINTVSNEDWYFFSGRKGTIVAGFAGRLFMSRDTGAGFGITSVCAYPTAACFPDPDNDSLILVAEYNQGVYRSNDGGMTWSPPVSQLPRINTFASWEGVLFAGIKGLGMQISYDTGATWAYFDSGLHYIRFITDLLVVDTLLYAGTDGAGVWVFNLNELGLTAVSRSGKNTGQGVPSPSWKTVVNMDGKRSGAPLRCYDLRGRRLQNVPSACGVKCIHSIANKLKQD